MKEEPAYIVEKHLNVPLIMTTFFFVFLLYAGLNYWIYQQARAQNQNVQALTPVQSDQQPIQTNVQSSAPSSGPKTKPTIITPAPTKTAVQQLIPSKATPTVKSATAAPKASPLIYACDPSGLCGVYHEPKEKGCPKTYTDVLCSGECTKPEVRCTI